MSRQPISQATLLEDPDPSVYPLYVNGKPAGSALEAKALSETVDYRSMYVAQTEHAALYFGILASADRFASQSNSDLKNSLDQVNKAAAL